MLFNRLRRRQFISLLGGAAAWPLAARAQQPTIGFLSAIPSNDTFLAAFRLGLAEAGYVEGQNVTIEYRFADRNYDQLPDMASDLVRRQVALIVAAGGSPSAAAAKAVTTTIPIIFTGIDDPVSSGFVASLNRPGGNMTGMSTLLAALGGKRFALLREMIPRAMVIGMLINPEYPPAAAEAADIENATRAEGREVFVLRASSESEIEAAFATISKRRPDALIIGADPFFNSRRTQLVTHATCCPRPSPFNSCHLRLVGGLMSYGTSFADNYRQTGIYVGRILKGDKPSDLPVMQPTKFELVINLKTAKALGLTVPLTLQVAADEVIE
jgi:putative ABC transport system substrate-binding protein